MVFQLIEMVNVQMLDDELEQPLKVSGLEMLSRFGIFLNKCRTNEMSVFLNEAKIMEEEIFSLSAYNELMHRYRVAE
ncbi:MAG: hypothetical protein JWQ09_2964 [Segetibacter sp.]|nr:hypothetical protein [Segetibacter sp.]